MIPLPPQAQAFILKYVAIPLVLAVVILLAVWAVDRHIRKDERKRCDAEYAELAKQADEKAQKKITEVRNDYKKIDKDMPAGDGKDYPAPAVDYVIDRLRERFHHDE